LAERRGFSGDHCRDERRPLEASEGQAAASDLIHQHAEAVEIAADCRRPTGENFRRAVVQRTDNHSSSGEICSGLVARCNLLGQAEVENLDHTIGVNHDVARLDIAMDDTPGVGVVECAGDLERIIDHPAGGHRAGSELLLQRAAIDVFHR
jgi:hypothetical protein